MANSTDKSILTAAGKALLAQLNAEEKALVIDKMIFANVPNRPEYPQPDDVVPTDHIVHQEQVEQRGRLSADSVIYSSTLTSDVGPFDFNWTGAYCSEYGVLVTIDHHALTPKTEDEPGVTGNTLVRSVVLEYKDIAEITNITVDASSWQYNATKRMKKMDSDVAQAIIDQNGKDWFLENGFLVTPSGNAYGIKAGAGYISGNRVAMDFDRSVQVPNKPSFIYIDAHREGTPTGEQVTLFNFVVTAEEKDDYTDSSTGKDVKHFVCKIAHVLADGSVSDLRPKGESADKNWVYDNFYLTLETVSHLKAASLRSGLVVDTKGYDFANGVNAGRYQIWTLEDYRNEIGEPTWVPNEIDDFTIDNGNIAKRVPFTASNAVLKLRVGNDPKYTNYHFSQLNDALEYATSFRIGSNTKDKSRVQISIPDGVHEFDSIQLRNEDLRGIQVWGPGKDLCSIKCNLNNVTHGVWLQSLFSDIADWGGFKLLPGDDVTVTRDPAISCQRWLDNSPPPWGDEKQLVYISSYSGTVKRLFGIDFADEDGGVLLGVGIDVTGSMVTMDDMHATNIREPMAVYNGSVVSVGYAGFTGRNIYTGGRCHEGTVTFRDVDFSGKLQNDGKPLLGSNFFDCFRGDVRIWDGHASGFDDYMVMTGGIFIDQMNPSNRTNINHPFNCSSDDNIIATKEPLLPSELVLSTNVIRTNDGQPAMGKSTYTGDGTSSRIVHSVANTKKVTIRRLSDDFTLSVIRNEVAQIQGAHALWGNGDDGSFRVYGQMNIVGVEYELNWER